MKRIIFTLLSLFWVHLVMAQYPVTSIPQLVAPHSIYLTDYIVPGSDKFTLNIWLNDNNELDYDVRLFLQIEGEGISLKTAPDFIPPPLNLSAGGNTLYGGDIQEYFNLNNMVIAGIDEQTLMQTGALPPGMYSFCVQAFDYRRQDVVLSQRGCTTVALSNNNPPIPTYPNCGSVVATNTQSNLMFQWQSMADNTIQAEYSFTLVEVPPGMSADDALNGSGRTLIAPGEAITLSTQFIYDANQLPLEAGKTYAYRIQVLDTEGYTTFENDGLSQSCFFYYGMPEAGGITLKRPNNGKKLSTTKETSTIRFVWDGPENALPNQEFNYELNLVELEVGQTPEEAMLYNPVLWDTIGDVGFKIAGDEMRKKITLPYGKVFAWQVSALIDGSEFAKSPVWTFNKGGLLEDFYAGDLQVIVDETNTFDLDHFSGKGRVLLGDDEEYTTVHFEDIAVQAAAKNYMTRGEIKARLNDFEVPLAFGDNGEANFRGDSIIINTEDVLLRGQVVWDYPHPTTQTGSIAAIKSKPKRVLFNGNKIIDFAFFEETTFELLDPYSHTVRYLDNSFFEISNNVLTTSMNIEVTLPETVKTPDGQRIMIPFFEQTDIYYLTNPSLTDIAPIDLLNGTSVTMTPKSAVCDLSRSQSPGNKSADANWKGTYLGDYSLNFPTDFDESNQLQLNSTYTTDVALSNDSNFKSWIDGSGLQYYYEQEYGSNAPKSIFNTFQDDWTALEIDIENSSVKSGHIKGEVDIPLLDANNAFAFTVPIDEDGLKTGFIDEDLTQREVVFNDNKPDLRVEMAITKATFANNDRLNLEVNLDWQHVGLHLEKVTDLRLWGNGNFGFKTPNGKKGVDNVTGKYVETYDITIDSLCAGFGNGAYALGFIGSIVLGDADAGISGTANSNPPKFNMVSAEERSGVNFSGGISANTGWVSDYLDRNIIDPINNQELAISMSVEVKTAVAEIKGTIISLLNDPDWGNAFYGNMEATVKKPRPFGLDATLLIGKKEDVSYWFVELGLSAVEPSDGGKPKNKPAGKNVSMANTGKGMKGGGGKKPKGGGIKLGKVEIIEVMGRVYHHMNHDLTEGMFGSCIIGEDDGEAASLIPDIPKPSIDIGYEVDASTSYGAMLKVGLQDAPTGGTIAQGYGALEITFDQDKKLKQIGLQVEAGFGMDADAEGFEDAVVHAVGCLTYTTASETFVASLAAKADGKGICAEGLLQLQISPGQFSLDIGTREKRISVNPACGFVTMNGWLGVDQVGDVVDVEAGIGVDVGFELSDSLDVGICTAIGYIKGGFDFTAAGKVQVQPVIKMHSVDAEFNAYLAVGGSCGIVEIELVDIHVGGTVKYTFDTKHIEGTLTATIKVVGVKAELGFDADMYL